MITRANSPRYIRHLTIDTGHQRDSYRAEVADEVVAMLRPLIVQAKLCLAPIPGSSPECTMLAWTDRARGLLCAVYGPPTIPTDGQSCLLTRFWVAPTSLAAVRAWEGVVKSGFAAADQQPPPAPWCAVALGSGLGLHPQAAHWLGDFERCIAWAWIDQ